MAWEEIMYVRERPFTNVLHGDQRQGLNAHPHDSRLRGTITALEQAYTVLRSQHAQCASHHV